MKNKSITLRLVYSAVFLILAVCEVLIAAYVKDAFIRPYGGDILITILLCAFVRIFFPNGVKLLPMWVFLFSVAVEFGQYFKMVELLGLGQYEFFRTWMGTSFSFIDILCYGVGCVLFFLAERLLFRA